MKVLSIIIDSDLRAAVAKTVKADSMQVIESKDQFFEEYENFNEGSFSAVICEVLSNEFANEVAQVIRTQCGRTPLFACALDKAMFEPKVLIKNGFTDAFLLPIDLEDFKDRLGTAVSPEALSKRMFKRVLIPDLQAGTVPSFNTYVHLPLNNKYLLYSSKNETFSEKKATKLRDHQVGTLFIDQKETSAFFEYVASQMKHGDNTLSATERQDKLKESVRGIFREMFDQGGETTFDSGRDLLDSCRKMVSAYVMDGTSGGDFHARLLRNISGSSLDYSHAADVSTLAALFGMVIGSAQVESLAIAGFLHDLSLAQFPEEHGYELDETWTDASKKTYLDHPMQSVNYCKMKKMILTPEAEKAILQHHERFNGKGFPRGLIGERISEEAQILSLADQFHYLTIVQPGEARTEPLDAIERIEANGSIAPAIIRMVKAVLQR